MRRLRLIYALIITLGAYTAVLAQYPGPYVPLRFSDLDPVWTKTTIDSSIIDYDPVDARAFGIAFDGYCHIMGALIEVDPVLHEGYYYKVARTIYDVDVSGALIEKIDLATGELVWQSAYDLRSQDYREFTQRAMIVGGRLRLINLRITTPDSDREWLPPIVAFGALWAEGLLKIREYDLETGELVVEDVADIDDPEVASIWAGLDMSNHMYPLETGDYVALHHIHEGIVGHYLVIDTLSSDGKVVNESDTIVTEFVDSDWGHDYHQNHFKVIRTADGTIYKLDYYVPGAHLTDSPPQAAIVIYDTAYRKRIIEVPEMIDKTQVKGWLLRRVEDGTLLIETNRFDESRNYYLLDIETGELLRRTHIRYDYGDSVVPYIRRTGEIYYPEVDFEDGHYYLRISHSVDDTLRPGPRFQMADAGFRFGPTGMHPLPDGSFLITGVYHSFVNDVFAGTFSAEMLVTPEMLGLVPTSVAVQVPDQSDFTLYPSPTRDVLYITGGIRDIDAVLIINSLGQTLRQTVTDGRIDVTSLEPGIYWLRLPDGSSSRPFVKI